MQSSVFPTQYGAVAKSFHWLMAILLAGMFGLGFYMSDLEFSPTKLKLFSWHKWAGVTVFVLALMRLAWRWVHPPPPLPAGMPAWQHRAAQGSHAAIYLLLLAIPLSGWLMSSAKGFQTIWFGVLPLPDLLDKNLPLGERLEEVHEILNFLLLGLLGVHVAAALKHHFIDRDDVLARMTPGLRPRGRSAS